MATETMNQGEVHVGVDVGGTFTDAVVISGDRIATAKVPSTPDDQGLGVIAAVLEALGKLGCSASDVTRFAHGMTVGTNALLEGTYAPIAFVTTDGFADIIEIRRQDRADLYRLEVHHSPPIVPASRRFEVTERVSAHGVLTPLDMASVAAAVERVRDANVEAAAVGLLFSFADPDHERQVVAALTAAMPDLHVSASWEVLPEIREYERFSTTCIDAALAPVLRRYLTRLSGHARAAGLPAPVIMQSNGGVIGLDAATRHAAWTVLPGPAAGVLGAAHVAARCGEPRALTFDMGGTSCDVALIDGSPGRTSQTTINGHPLHLPMLDVHTVSAGGGSVAWVDDGGALRVGPRSAGAVPGPAAYGRGGTAATVTDANIVLGRIDVSARFAGALTLDADAARQAVAVVADRLGVTVERCAEGIVQVAVQEMVRALRVVSVERGIDPRDMALVALGGAGPLHACAVAEELGMRTIVVPHEAGLLAALGLIVAGERRDHVQTVLAPVEAADTELRERISTMTREAARTLPGAVCSAEADCRYVGQTHALTVPWDPDRPAADLAATFHAAHERRYGVSEPEQPIHVVSIRLAAHLPGITPESSTQTPPAPTGVGRFVVGGATGWIDAGWVAKAVPDAVVMRRD